MLENIESSRLWLVPVNLEICEQLLTETKPISKEQQYEFNDHWPTMDTMEILPYIYESLQKNKQPTGFEFWMIVLKEGLTVIGDIGFHGLPDEFGMVEIGYGLVNSEQGKGYGYEALSHLMEWIKLQPEVMSVKAECLIDNVASAKILEKVGMHEVERNKVMMSWELVLEGIC